MLIDRLQAQGHVRRVPDPADRRRVIVEALPGSDVRGLEAFLPVALAIDAVARSFGEDDQRVISRFLTEVAAVYQRLSDEG